LLGATSHQALAKLAEYGNIKSRILQLQTQQIFPIHATAHRVRRRPVRETFHELEYGVAGLRAAGEQHQGHPNAKTHALAVELLSDWDAVFQVLHHPELPVTNNDAERALRHWMIARKISHGTRTATGSRVLALLASVIDTCRQRGHSPWLYLQTAIADRRAGHPLAPLLQAGR
jgi:hypothetical protein